MLVFRPFVSSYEMFLESISLLHKWRRWDFKHCDLRMSVCTDLMGTGEDSFPVARLIHTGVLLFFRVMLNNRACSLKRNLCANFTAVIDLVFAQYR